MDILVGPRSTMMNLPEVQYSMDRLDLIYSITRNQYARSCKLHARFEGRQYSRPGLAWGDTGEKYLSSLPANGSTSTLLNRIPYHFLNF